MSDKLQEELYEDLQEGRFDGSFGYLKNRRSDIERVTGLSLPRGVELLNWYQNMKPVLSRKLNPENTPDEDSNVDGEIDDNQEGDQE